MSSSLSWKWLFIFLSMLLCCSDSPGQVGSDNLKAVSWVLNLCGYLWLLVGMCGDDVLADVASHRCCVVRQVGRGNVGCSLPKYVPISVLKAFPKNTDGAWVPDFCLLHIDGTVCCVINISGHNKHSNWVWVLELTDDFVKFRQCVVSMSAAWDVYKVYEHGGEFPWRWILCNNSDVLVPTSHQRWRGLCGSPGLR